MHTFNKSITSIYRQLPRHTAAFRRFPIAGLPVALAIVIPAAACSSSATTSTAPSATKCTIGLAASPASLGRAGGTGTVTVTTAPECPWTATSDANWIASFVPASGQGNGQVEFRVSANPAATPRLGDIVVNTSHIQVRQDSSSCVFELATRSQTFSETGGLGTATLSATPDGCAWTATTNASWIAIASGDNGAGSGSVNFVVQANRGPERSGSLTIAGQTFTVRQGGAPGTCTYALSPATQAIGAAGGAGVSVSVSAAARCAWTASADVPWITLPAAASGTGNGTIAVAVAANTGPARSGTVTVEGQEFTVTQAAAVAPPCVYTLSSSSQAIGATGGTGTPVTVSTAQACAWTASAAVSWITVTSGGSGSGNGTISFSVAANTGPARSGTVSVTGGEGFTVNQAATAPDPTPDPAPTPTCSYSVSPGSQSIGAAGGAGTPATVSTAPGCAWSASADVAWITLTGGASGSGNGTIAFSVAANGGAARSGTVTVTGGQRITVNQAAPPPPSPPPAPTPTCSYAVSPGSQSIGAAGGAGTPAAVSTAPGCAWSASSDEDWITLPGGASGSGNGTISFTVAANGGAARTGTVTVTGGQRITVNQAAAPAPTCSYTVNPESQSIGAAGGTAASVVVTANPGCAWTAVAQDSWIAVTGGASGGGNGTVTLRVAPNNGAPRSGNVTVAGKVVAIQQAGACLVLDQSDQSGNGRRRRARYGVCVHHCGLPVDGGQQRDLDPRRLWRQRQRQRQRWLHRDAQRRQEGQEARRHDHHRGARVQSLSVEEVAAPLIFDSSIFLSRCAGGGFVFDIPPEV